MNELDVILRISEFDAIHLLSDFTKRRYIIYSYIKRNYCTISDIARKFNISYKEAYREVSILLSMKYITKIRLETKKNRPCVLRTLNDKRDLAFFLKNLGMNEIAKAVKNKENEIIAREVKKYVPLGVIQ